MKLKDIKALIELINEQGFAEFEIEKKGFRLKVRRYSDAALPSAPGPFLISPRAGELPVRRGEQHAIEVEVPQPPPITPAEPIPEPPPTPEAQLHIIKSPIVGTFYRAASPTASPFVSVGDRVESDTVVCIIEAMKLMNEIQAEVSGEIVKTHVENGQPVEYGQPLFTVRV
jgi:acetyl-CoA carboxylase biotin carboxyl carrier protein